MTVKHRIQTNGRGYWDVVLAIDTVIENVADVKQAYIIAKQLDAAYNNGYRDAKRNITEKVYDLLLEV